MGRFTAVADILESAFDEGFPLFADVVVDGGHRLDGASGRTGERKFAVDDLTLVHGKRAVAKYDETAVGEGTTFVFVEVEDDFLVAECVFGDFHRNIVGTVDFVRLNGGIQGTRRTARND